jgi:hypothetical protein
MARIAGRRGRVYLGVTTAAAATPVTAQATVDKFIRAIKLAKSFRGLVEEAYTIERGRRVRQYEKKLAGAAKASFLKKCEKDATVACQAASKEKKLSGAAKEVRS